MRYLKSFENYNFDEYVLGSGETVILNKNHVHNNVWPNLKEALLKVDSGGKGFIKTEVQFDHVIGVSHCVEVTEDDEIYYKKRTNRKKASKMVAKREPTPCNKITVILIRRSGGYRLITAYIGGLSEPEIWDNRAFQNAPDFRIAKQKSIDFWDKHALIEEL